MRSRCTMPRRSAWASPASTSSSTRADLGERQLADERRSEPRSRYSIAMYGVPSVLEVVVDGDDVRDGSASRRRATRAGSAAANAGSPACSAGELLQRDEPVEVAPGARGDGRHPAATDLPQNLVTPDGPGRIRHRAAARLSVQSFDPRTAVEGERVAGHRRVAREAHHELDSPRAADSILGERERLPVAARAVHARRRAPEATPAQRQRDAHVPRQPRLRGVPAGNPIRCFTSTMAKGPAGTPSTRHSQRVA